jgi:hypothetical protein
VLVSCTGPSLEQLLAAEDLPPTALTRLSMERALVAVRDGRSVRLFEFRAEQDGWVRQEISRSGIGDAVSSVHLQSLDGETGDEWNTFIYGAAPPQVSRVQIEGYEGEGGRVVQGTWVIALRDTGLAPADVHWTFVDALGAVVDSGTGIFP